MLQHPSTTRCLRVVAALAVVAGVLAPTAASAKPKHDRSETTTSSVSSDRAEVAPTAGSMTTTNRVINANDVWQLGHTGTGIDIAVIDTGISPVPALSDPSKIAAVVDLSLEADVPEARYLDTYGHGTHIAGIAAGRSPDADTSSESGFIGVAPDARIVSVKVGDNTGAVDVTQVIAAIDWVVQHRNDGDLNIRVLNLSYGTDSTQSYEVDPLTAAVERAWDAGIVVIVAAGNDGGNDSAMTTPANDPYVIAVGAAEVADWGITIPSWSGTGEWSTNGTKAKKNSTADSYTGRTPDVVAPGVSIESLRVPNSRIDQEHSSAVVDDELIRGSGSSQAAAVVSGAAALLLEADPDLTPDQIKAALMATATPVQGYSVVFQGAGLIDIEAAIAAPASTKVQTHQRSSGLGSIEASRGTQHIVVDGVTVRGEVTAWGDEWAGATVVADALQGSSWSGSSWSGSSWSGSSWSGSSWSGSSWSGSSWSGSSWSGSSWSGSSWSGAGWF